MSAFVCFFYRGTCWFSTPCNLPHGIVQRRLSFPLHFLLYISMFSLSKLLFVAPGIPVLVIFCQEQSVLAPSRRLFFVSFCLRLTAVERGVDKLYHYRKETQATTVGSTDSSKTMTEILSSMSPRVRLSKFMNEGIPPGRGAHTSSAAYTYHDPTALENDVHDYLVRLDEVRQQAEREGDFIKAQQCVNRMRDCSLRLAKKVQQESTHTNEAVRDSLANDHKLELHNFSRYWEEKIAQYEQQADLVLDEVKVKHAEDYQCQEEVVREQLMKRRPRFSKTVLWLRKELERCVTQRRYLEAEEHRQKLVVQEQVEIDAFDKELAIIFERKTSILKQHYVTEMRAVEQKIKLGREEILTRRKVEFEKLLRRQTNAMKELDQKTRLYIARTKQYVERQVRALVYDPLKTTVDTKGTMQYVGALGVNRNSNSRATSPAAGKRPGSSPSVNLNSRRSHPR